jgi:hypothetical protein
MPFELTNSDREITDQPIVLIDLQGVEPIGGPVPGGPLIHFQFPPILKSDSKDNRWTTEYNNYAWEPQYHFKGGNARKISLLITYIVGGPQLQQGGGAANIENISREVKRIRSYFYMAGPNASGKLPVYHISMYKHVHNGAAAFRATGISASYSDVLIRQSGDIYPLKTEITLTLEMATKILLKDGTEQARHENIPSQPKQEWY